MAGARLTTNYFAFACGGRTFSVACPVVTAAAHLQTSVPTLDLPTFDY